MPSPLDCLTNPLLFHYYVCLFVVCMYTCMSVRRNSPAPPWSAPPARPREAWAVWEAPFSSWWYPGWDLPQPPCPQAVLSRLPRFPSLPSLGIPGSPLPLITNNAFPEFLVVSVLSRQPRVQSLSVFYVQNGREIIFLGHDVVWLSDGGRLWKLHTVRV